MQRPRLGTATSAVAWLRLSPCTSIWLASGQTALKRTSMACGEMYLPPIRATDGAGAG